MKQEAKCGICHVLYSTEKLSERMSDMFQRFCITPASDSYTSTRVIAGNEVERWEHDIQTFFREFKSMLVLHTVTYVAKMI
jgi:hypothetical protein